jgi:hypothetical protein
MSTLFPLLGVRKARKIQTRGQVTAVSCLHYKSRPMGTNNNEVNTLIRQDRDRRRYHVLGAHPSFEMRVTDTGDAGHLLPFYSPTVLASVNVNHQTTMITARVRRGGTPMSWPLKKKARKLTVIRRAKRLTILAVPTLGITRLVMR